MAVPHRESVHIPAPSIPSGDQGPDYRALEFGHQKSGRGVFDKAFNVIDTVSGARVLAPCPIPERQHLWHIASLASTNFDFASGQAESIARGAKAPARARASECG